MKFSEMFPSKYVSAEDLRGQDVPVVIRDVLVEELAGDEGGHARKPVVYFQGQQKGLVLNKTNAKTIAGLYGDETEHWRGKAITLYPSETQFRSEIRPCIRVRGAPPSAGGGPPAPLLRRRPLRPPAFNSDTCHLAQRRACPAVLPSPDNRSNSMSDLGIMFNEDDGAPSVLVYRSGRSALRRAVAICNAIAVHAVPGNIVPAYEAQRYLEMLLDNIDPTGRLATGYASGGAGRWRWPRRSGLWNPGVTDHGWRLDPDHGGAPPKVGSLGDRSRDSHESLGGHRSAGGLLAVGAERGAGESTGASHD